MSKRILKLPEAVNRTGISRSAIYLKIAKGEFPSPINLSTRSVGFLESEIESWIDERVKVSRPNQVEAD